MEITRKNLPLRRRKSIGQKEIKKYLTMGSASTSAALISHLQLNRCCFKLVESTRIQLEFNSLKFRHSRRGRLEFAASRLGKGFRTAICFAAVDDDVKENRQQVFSETRSASATEDRPGINLIFLIS